MINDFSLKLFLRRCGILLIILSILFLSIEIFLTESEWSRSKAIKKFNSIHGNTLLGKKRHVVPSLSPLVYLQKSSLLFEKKQYEVLPLSGVPNAHTVVCKEEVELQYFSDRYGFNNPDINWDKKNVDIAFIGDSYIQGYCVKSESHFLNLLTSSTPSLSVLNLGLFGSGPISELAILKEYASLKKPKTVVWTYMSNDLISDLPQEESHPILSTYLIGQTQNLVDKGSDIEAIQSTLLESTPPIPITDYLFSVFSFNKTRKSLITQILRKTRAPLFIQQQTLDYQSIETINWILYKQILQKAKNITEQWRGKILFLYLPDPQQWDPQLKNQVTLFRRNLFNLLSELQIPVLDFSLFLSRQSNPLDFYTVFQGQYGHLNEQGQQQLTHFLRSSL